jgi:hypothetical protein
MAKKEKPKKLASQNVPLPTGATPDRLKRNGQVKSKYRITEGNTSGGGRVPVSTVRKTSLSPKRAAYGAVTGEGKGTTKIKKAVKALKK